MIDSENKRGLAKKQTEAYYLPVNSMTVVNGTYQRETMTKKESSINPAAGGRCEHFIVEG
jgi:hypothetical protein